VGCQGRQGNLEALRPAMVLATRPQEVGPHQPRGPRGSEGVPVRCVVTKAGGNQGANDVAPKAPKIVFKARRVR
jgi:hypothetical protein